MESDIGTKKIDIDGVHRMGHRLCMASCLHKHLFYHGHSNPRPNHPQQYRLCIRALARDSSCLGKLQLLQWEPLS